MKSPRDDSSTQAPKPARWVSPWSYDDEWEREYAKPAPKKKTESPDSIPAKVQVEKIELAPEAAVISAFGRPAKEPAKLVTDARTKSFEDFGSFNEIQDPELMPVVSADVVAPKPDLSRFRPPTLIDPIIPQLVAKAPELTPPAPPKTSELVTPPQIKPALLPKVESAGPSLPTLTPPRRATSVPVSSMTQAKPASSWGSSIILCLGMFGLVMLAWIYLTDVKLGSDEDLRVQIAVDQAPKIAAPERLLTFLNAVMKIEKMDLARQPVWDWDPVLLDSFVQANSKSNTFDNLLDLLEDFDWHPHHSAWHTTDLGDHASWPHVRILLQARSIFLLRHGNEAAAFSAAIDIAEMSRRMQELWAWPTFMQRSQEIHMAAVQVMAELLKKTLLNSADLKIYQDEFIQCEPSDSMLQDAFRGFYIHEKSLLFGEKAGVPLDTLPGGILQERPARLFFKKNETLSLFADVFRQLRNEIVIPTFSILGPAAQATTYSRRSHSFSFQPNGAGEAYFADRIDPYLDMPARHSLAKARHSLVVCLFATRRFIADQQRLPTGLSELKPSYLMEVPTDGFSGEPLQYDALSGLIFSVGNDYIGAGGKVTNPALLDASEPTVDIGIKVSTPAQSNQ